MFFLLLFVFVFFFIFLKQINNNFKDILEFHNQINIDNNYFFNINDLFQAYDYKKKKYLVNIIYPILIDKTPKTYFIRYLECLNNKLYVLKKILNLGNFFETSSSIFGFNTLQTEQFSPLK